jgi:2-dehydropantoate 2-reductase
MPDAPGHGPYLIDLEQGKPIEVDTLIGTVVRKGRASGVPTPLMALLHAVLAPWEHGRPQGT